MVYTEMTTKAMKLAYTAHLTQVDKSGVPYIFHPYHLAEQMTDEISCTVALLHDVVEDTDVTIEDLSREFPKEVTDAIKLLSHEDTVDYFEYVKMIKNNSIAKTVKLADLMHNSDQSRIVDAKLSEEKLASLREKYALAKKILME